MFDQRLHDVVQRYAHAHATCADCRPGPGRRQQRDFNKAPSCGLVWSLNAIVMSALESSDADSTLYVVDWPPGSSLLLTVWCLRSSSASRIEVMITRISEGSSHGELHGAEARTARVGFDSKLTRPQHCIDRRDWMARNFLTSLNSDLGYMRHPEVLCSHVK